MKQTAVEWLVEQLQNNVNKTQTELEYYINQAKQMEKEQIIQASCCGGDGESGAEIYYNETFKTE